jgi:hypothetical protein
VKTKIVYRLALLLTLIVLCNVQFRAQTKSKRKSKSSTSTKKTAPDPATQNAIDLKDNVIAKTNEYKLKLQEYVVFLEKDAKAKADHAEQLKSLLDQGLISKKELDKAQADVTKAQALVNEQRKEIGAADNLIEEVEASKQILLLPPPKIGAYVTTAVMIRYNGASGWDLGQTAELQNFFSQKFGRALPISAYGQTATHEKLGFDHSNRMDVAVSPDSGEGQAVMEYLRARGIPFIAFRHAVAGSATGAHIHVGPPSHRIQ